MRPETGFGPRAVNFPDDGIQCAFQISHCDAFVHNQTFHLMKHGRMCRVHFIFPVHPAGRNHTDRHAVRFHSAYLHGRSLRTQKGSGILIQIECVGPLTGGVIVRRIEFVEIIRGFFHFRTVQHFKAHIDKNFFEFIQRCIHGMLMSDRNGFPRNRYVYSFQRKSGFHGFFFQKCRLFFQCLFQSAPDFIGFLTHGGTQFGGKRSHLFEYGG